MKERELRGITEEEYDDIKNWFDKVDNNHIISHTINELKKSGIKKEKLSNKVKKEGYDLEAYDRIKKGSIKAFGESLVLQDLLKERTMEKTLETVSKDADSRRGTGSKTKEKDEPIR